MNVTNHSPERWTDYGNRSMARYARFAEVVLDDIGAPTGYFLGRSHGGFVHTAEKGNRA